MPKPCENCPEKSLWTYEFTHEPGQRLILATVYADMDRLEVPPSTDDIAVEVLLAACIRPQDHNAYTTTNWFKVPNDREQRLVAVGFAINY